MGMEHQKTYGAVRARRHEMNKGSVSNNVSHPDLQPVVGHAQTNIAAR